MDNHSIIKALRDARLQANRQKQVSNRLRILLPTRLRAISRELRFQEPSKKRLANQRALTSQDYLNHIEELVTIESNALEARLQFEHFQLTLKARQSLRSKGPLRRTALQQPPQSHR